jgi:hypothetical protein
MIDPLLFLLLDGLKGISAQWWVDWALFTDIEPYDVTFVMHGQRVTVNSL